MTLRQLTAPLRPARALLGLAGLLLVGGLCCGAPVDPSFSARVADRTAIERVYYSHRLGTQAPFETALPPAQIETLVRREQRQETALRRAYGVAVTPEMVAAEVKRIDATTQAPEILAELKQALGNDPARFARALARPIVVERTLRARFEQDDALHAPQRRSAEALREQLLAARQAGRPPTELAALLQAAPPGPAHEIQWQLTPRPADDRPAPASPAPATKVVAQGGVYQVEATAQVAQVLGAPGGTAAGERKHYFEDLEPELQKVLRVQLRQPGDVSAVIEAPHGFLLYVLNARTDESLTVTAWSASKRSFEDWLAGPAGDAAETSAPAKSSPTK